jgi:hypothetical protein
MWNIQSLCRAVHAGWGPTREASNVQATDNTKQNRQIKISHVSTFATEFAFLTNTVAGEKQGHAWNNTGNNRSRLPAPRASNSDTTHTAFHHAASKPESNVSDRGSGPPTPGVLLTAAERRERVGAARVALYGRSWRQLDVRSYLIKRSQMAPTLQALREAAAQDPSIEAAVRAILAFELSNPQADDAGAELDEEGGSWDEEEGEEDGHEQGAGGGKQPSRTGAVRVWLPRQRGNGEVDDALPTPQVYYKLPLRWRGRILSERVAGLRLKLQHLAPGVAAAMLGSAPVVLCLTSAQVTRRVQDLSRALRCSVNEAALAVSE